MFSKISSLEEKASVNAAFLYPILLRYFSKRFFKADNTYQPALFLQSEAESMLNLEYIIEKRNFEMINNMPET